MSRNVTEAYNIYLKQLNPDFGLNIEILAVKLLDLDKENELTSKILLLATRKLYCRRGIKYKDYKRLEDKIDWNNHKIADLQLFTLTYIYQENLYFATDKQLKEYLNMASWKEIKENALERLDF